MFNKTTPLKQGTRYTQYNHEMEEFISVQTGKKKFQVKIPSPDHTEKVTDCCPSCR